MYSIIKNVCKILFKRKGFVFTTFLLPIGLVFLFSILYSSNSTVNVAVINNDTGKLGNVIVERIKSMDGVKVIKIKQKEDKIENLIFNKYAFSITIDKDFSDRMINGHLDKIRMKSISTSQTQITMSGIIENETKNLVTLCNNIDVSKVGVDNLIDTYNKSKTNINVLSHSETKTINTSLGIIIYVISISACLSAVFLLEDEREGTKERILMSKVDERIYYGSMGIIFFILSAVPAIEYYLVCKLFGYQFGFKHTYYLLIIMLFIVFLSVIFSLFITTIVKKKSLYSLISSAATVPLFMLSGCFWQFKLMGKTLRKIGSAFPQRWTIVAVEKLQKGGGFIEILPQLGGILLVAILFFLLSVFFARNKTVLIKDDK